MSIRAVRHVVGVVGGGVLGIALATAAVASSPAAAFQLGGEDFRVCLPGELIESHTASADPDATGSSGPHLAAEAHAAEIRAASSHRPIGDTEELRAMRAPGMRFEWDDVRPQAGSTSSDTEAGQESSAVWVATKGGPDVFDAVALIVQTESGGWTVETAHYCAKNFVTDVHAYRTADAVRLSDLGTRIPESSIMELNRD